VVVPYTAFMVAVYSLLTSIAIAGGLLHFICPPVWAVVGAAVVEVPPAGAAVVVFKLVVAMAGFEVVAGAPVEHPYARTRIPASNTKKALLIILDRPPDSLQFITGASAISKEAEGSTMPGPDNQPNYHQTYQLHQEHRAQASPCLRYAR
jgi:hypothetical protein